MCASNNYTQKQNGTFRRQHESSQATTYRSQLAKDDTGFDDDFDDDDECHYVGPSFTQRSSRQPEYYYQRQPTATSRYVNSQVQSPSVKRKHNETSVGEALILEKLNELTEQLATLREDNEQQMKKILKKQEKTQKIVYKVAYTHDHAAPTNSSSSSQLEPVIFNDHNLLDNVDSNQKPTAFLCKLVRRLYTVEEIEKGIIHDERMSKIKQAVRVAYYSDDFNKFDIFWKTQAHISLQGQKRSQTYRARNKTDDVNLNVAQ